MILFDSILISFLYCCSSEYPGQPALPIDHGKFHFSAPAVHFLEERNLGIDFMKKIEKKIEENPGQGDILYGNNSYVSVVGVKGNKRHFGCFSDDEKCRITGFLEMPK